MNVHTKWFFYIMHLYLRDGKQKQAIYLISTCILLARVCFLDSPPKIRVCECILRAERIQQSEDLGYRDCKAGEGSISNRRNKLVGIKLILDAMLWFIDLLAGATAPTHTKGRGKHAYISRAPLKNRTRACPAHA